MAIEQKTLVLMLTGFLGAAVLLGIGLTASLLRKDVRDGSSSEGTESMSTARPASEETILYDEAGNPMTMDPANYHRTGRFLATGDENEPSFASVWTGAEITFGFSGTEAWCFLSGQVDTSNLQGVYAGVYIDGAQEPSTVLCVTEADWYRVAEGLVAGDHVVRIIKHSEAFGGRLTFFRIRVTAPGIILQPPPLPELALEIIGDSITAGYGNMADRASDPFRIDQENGAAAYGAILARRLNARAHYIAWSGIGVLQNNDGRSVNTMPMIYERTAPGINRESWDFTSYIPDIIVVHLGTNDMASNADPSLFETAYADFIRQVRGKNPDAAIFCTMGVMGTRLVPSMEAAVEVVRIEGDGNVFCVPMEQQSASDGYGADGHPSLATHSKMAEVLFEAINDRRNTAP
jgi:hypothetical protein